MYYATWHYGQEMWKYKLPFGIEAGNAMELVLHASAMSNVPVCIYNIYK
jgi:ethanolaminephosphotransferase